MMANARRGYPRRWVRAVAVFSAANLMALGALTTTAGRASASLLPDCGARSTSTPFAPWGDRTAYFGMPGGTFEDAAPGWTLAGATIDPGNETGFVNAAGDSHSLTLAAGASATAPTICVALGENTIRLFARNPGVAGSVLHVRASVQNPLTGLVLTTGFDVVGSPGAAGWAPTEQLVIPNLLGGLLGTQNLTLRFTTRGTAAPWAIDDVYVDPFRSH